MPVITRSKVTKIEEEWSKGQTKPNTESSAATARIDIDHHLGKINIFGRDVQVAEELRDFVLRAVEAYRGV